MDQNCDDRTQRSESDHSTASFIDAVQAGGSAVGTADVAEAVGCSHETAYKRLRALEDDGMLESRKIGPARVWSLAEE